MSRLSTRARFILASLLLLAPVMAVATVLLNESFKRSQDQVVSSDFATADVVSQNIRELIDGQQQVLTALAEHDAIRSMEQPPDAASMLMDDYRVSRPSVNGLFLLRNDFTVAAQSGGVEISALPPEFQAAAESAMQGSQATVSDTIPLSSGDVEVIAIIVPVYTNSAAATAETPTGALGAFYSVERLIASYQPPGGFSTGSDIAIALVSPSGKVVSVQGQANDPSQIFKDGEDLTNAITSALGGQRTDSTFDDPSGLGRVMVAVPIALEGNDWAVLVSSPKSTAFGPTQVLIERAVLAGIGIVLLFLVFSALISEWLTRPFRQLATQARAWSTGRAVLELDPSGASDAAYLSRTIREMADRLRTQVRDTESAREEIARQAERLRDLLRRTVRLQEDERRRIASDIHDAVSPLITGALYQAQAVRIAKTNGNGNGHENGSGSGSEELAANAGLKEVSELLERAMRELHDVIFDLRPPDLDDIGIVAALQRHVDQVNRSGIPCTLEQQGEERRLPPEVRLAIYRIVQEALHNVMRHAHADESVVRIEWLPDRLRVTIQDDGSGFEHGGAGLRAGLGLMSMRERASSIGASLDVVSRLGSGTAIVVERAVDAIDLTAESDLDKIGVNGHSAEPESMIDEASVDAGEEQSVS